MNQLLIFAARAGNYALVKERLAQGADPNYFDPFHGSAAMEASCRGDFDVLNLLLECGLNPGGQAAVASEGIIEGALRYQHEEIAVLLIERGFRLMPHARSIYREQLQKAYKQLGKGKTIGS